MRSRGRRLLAACLWIGVLPAVSGPAGGVADHGSAHALLISGHRGPVLAIERDDARNLLFTAGADGTVRMWDPGTRALLRSITVTSLRASMLAVSPVDARFAFLATDAIHAFAVEVWDWQKAGRVFRIPVPDQPLFLRYSASGRYLMFGLPRWESMRIVSASDGSPVSFHPEGFGIVGFAALSRSEKILMTYRLTGEFSYWELASGKKIEGFPTVALLSRIRLTPDLSRVVGATDSDVYVVDVASGRVKAHAPLRGVTSLDVSPDGTQVACVDQAGVVSRWNISADSLSRAPDPPAGPPRATGVCFDSGGLTLGQAGGLATIGADGSTLDFPGDVRAEVTGMAVQGDSVALATASWIKVFTAGLPAMPRRGANVSEPVQSILVDNPFKAPVGVIFLDTGSLLVWQTGQGPGAYGILDVAGRTFQRAARPLAGPVIEAAADARRCLLLGTDGTLRVLDKPSGTTRVEMRRPGAVWATFASGNTVVVGGQAGDAEPGSLVRIDIDTGETVPIRTRNRYTYEVCYDPGSKTLYSLGVTADGATNLVAHSGADDQDETLVDSTPGERLSASLSLDSATGTLYTSLGHDRMSWWKEGSFGWLPVSALGTVSLNVGSGLLYSLNRDSSVTIMDAERRQPIGELSVFPDGGWAVLLPDGRFASSPGAETRVCVLLDGKPVRDLGTWLVPMRVAESR